MIAFKARHFYLALRPFGPLFLAMVDYHLEKGGMPLHDVVGVNCKKDATTENQGSDASYMG